MKLLMTTALFVGTVAVGSALSIPVAETQEANEIEASALQVASIGTIQVHQTAGFDAVQASLEPLPSDYAGLYPLAAAFFGLAYLSRVARRQAS
jgi:hypothetical protein